MNFGWVDAFASDKEGSDQLYQFSFCGWCFNWACLLCILIFYFALAFGCYISLPKVPKEFFMQTKDQKKFTKDILLPLNLTSMLKTALSSWVYPFQLRSTYSISYFNKFSRGLRGSAFLNFNSWIIEALLFCFSLRGFYFTDPPSRKMIRLDSFWKSNVEESSWDFPFFRNEF